MTWVMSPFSKELCGLNCLSPSVILKQLQPRKPTKNVRSTRRSVRGSSMYCSPSASSLVPTRRPLSIDLLIKTSCLFPEFLQVPPSFKAPWSTLPSLAPTSVRVPEQRATSIHFCIRPVLNELWVESHLLFTFGSGKSSAICRCPICLSNVQQEAQEATITGSPTSRARARCERAFCFSFAAVSTVSEALTSTYIRSTNYLPLARCPRMILLIFLRNWFRL